MVTKLVKIGALVVGAVVLSGAIGFGIYLIKGKRNPLPASIKARVNFQVAYPAVHQAPIDASTYQYQSDQHVLSFKANFAGANLVFSEQPAPKNLGSDTEAYYPALGIHPYAQFKTSLGLVALTKFWESGTLLPTGQSAILASHDTMILAHSDHDLTNQQWKSLFESLKITK